MSFENGKTYEVTHSRKGRFTLRVENQSEEWLTGLIVDGTESEEITVRKSFLSNSSEVTPTS